MGIFERIRNWFSRRSSAENVTPLISEKTIKSPRPIERPDDPVGSLVWEHEHLDSERSTLKDEMALVDSRFANGQLAAGDRDRAYRLCLARAGRISLRQMEIRKQLIQLGYEVPSEWGLVRRS